MSSIKTELNELAIKIGAPIVGTNISEQIRAINTHLGGTSHGANISERIDELSKVWSGSSDGGNNGGVIGVPKEIKEPQRIKKKEGSVETVSEFIEALTSFWDFDEVTEDSLTYGGAKVTFSSNGQIIFSTGSGATVSGTSYVPSPIKYTMIKGKNAMLCGITNYTGPVIGAVIGTNVEDANIKSKLLIGTTTSNAKVNFISASQYTDYSWPDPYFNAGTEGTQLSTYYDMPTSTVCDGIFRLHKTNKRDWFGVYKIKNKEYGIMRDLAVSE